MWKSCYPGREVVEIKGKLPVKCTVLLLITVLMSACVTRPSRQREDKVQEFSSPTGDVKLVVSSLSGYRYRNSRYGISFSLSNINRFNFWADDVGGTSREMQFSGGREIVLIDDGHAIANMAVHIMAKLAPLEMEKMIDEWNKVYHRTYAVLNLNRAVHELIHPNGANIRLVKYIDQTPDGSRRMFQVAYLEIPKNRLFVVIASNLRTYGDNTAELLELIRSVQIF